MQTRRWLQSALLILLGLYFLDNMVSGRIAFYINQSFYWLAWFAGVLFLVLGVIGVIDLVREPRVQPMHDHEHNHQEHDHDIHEGHAHSHAVSWPILGVIAIPLVLGVLVPAKPLGASAINTSGVTTSIGVAPSVANKSIQFSVAPTQRNVLDWIRAFSSSPNMEEFNNQPADVIGFVYRDVTFDESKHFMVARFTLSCCVADASAIGVYVEWPEAATVIQDSWVHVTGKFQVKPMDGENVPILVAETVEVVEQPAQPYLYP
jgi:putative membrane protein